MTPRKSWQVKLYLLTLIWTVSSIVGGIILERRKRVPRRDRIVILPWVLISASIYFEAQLQFSVLTRA